MTRKEQMRAGGDRHNRHGYRHRVAGEPRNQNSCCLMSCELDLFEVVHAQVTLVTSRLASSLRIIDFHDEIPHATASADIV
jgi:hypothetical protein